MATKKKKLPLLIVGALVAGVAVYLYKKSTEITDAQLSIDDVVTLRAVPHEDVVIDTGETQQDGSFVWEGHGHHSGTRYAFRATAVTKIAAQGSGLHDDSKWDPATVPSPTAAEIYT